MIRPPDFCKAEALLVGAGVKKIKKKINKTLPQIYLRYFTITKLHTLPIFLPILHLHNRHEY